MQIGSLRTDEEATARRAAAFYRDIDRRVADEAAALVRDRADIVLGDIPPLAFLAAANAGVPSIAIGNFTWDWIYSHYTRRSKRSHQGSSPPFASAYQTATAALRLPLHGGFESMAAITHDVPFIARRSARDPADTRRLLGVPDGNKLALVSFGAYGVDLPLDEVRRANPSADDRDGRPAASPPEVPGHRRRRRRGAEQAGLRDRVGMRRSRHAASVQERGRFIEYDVFVAEMPRVLRCRYISHEDLFAGRWTDAIDALLRQPDPPERARVDGAEVAADRILALEHSAATAAANHEALTMTKPVF